jgi:ABC-type transport system involved in multi-copper enzyme maturation permease subunit
MTVFRQTWEPWTGVPEAEGSRFLVITRYGLRRVFASRLAWVYLLASLLPYVAGGALIYVRGSPDVLPALRVVVQSMITIDAQFFSVLMGIGSTLAFFMAALIGPLLITPDLENGALPLYMSRPLSPAQYVLGKLVALAAVVSTLTWAPGLVLFLEQSLMGGWTWMADNSRIALALMVGGGVWTLTLTLMVLAISSWVRWRPLAGGALIGIFFMGGGIAVLLNEMLDTGWGTLLSLTSVMTAIWQSLLLGTVFEIDYPLPVWTAWATLILVWSASLGALMMRLRNAEINR